MIRSLRGLLAATSALALASTAHAQNVQVKDANAATVTIGAAKPGSASYLTSGVVSLTSTSLTSAISGVASNYIYVTDIDCFNTGQYTFTVSVLNSASTVLWEGEVPAGGGFTKSFTTWIGGAGHMTTGTAISIQAAQAGGSGATPALVCTLNGYSSAS